MCTPGAKSLVERTPFESLNVYARFSFSLNSQPGIKVKLDGKISMNHGFLLLNNSNTKVLGGHVEKLVENWELKRVSIF